MKNLKTFQELNENLKSDMQNILKTNTDWNIQVKNKKTDKIKTICNYSGATGQKTPAKNYPVGEEGGEWISREELIKDYTFVRSWTPKEMLDHVHNYKKFEQHLTYNIGDILVARRNYLDLFKRDVEYVIVDIENNLGDEMFYVSHNGKKISEWGLKRFELDINFIKK